MTQPSSNSRHTQVSQMVRAPREVVYQAFLDRDAVATWLAPDGMIGKVEVFEPREGGKIRMSLTYPEGVEGPPGKTSEDTDTSEGTFVELRPNEKIVQVFQFESEQPEFSGQMRMTWSLVDKDGETEVTVLSENIPEGIRLEDNEQGSRESLQKLAQFVEQNNVRG